MKKFRNKFKGRRNTGESKPNTQREGAGFLGSEGNQTPICGNSAASECITPPDIIEPTKYYFPGIDRKKAERILLQANIEDNTFVVRDGSTKGNYALSVRDKSRVSHFIIYYQDGRLSLDKINTFSTLERMINYYSKVTANQKVILSNCISKGDVEGSNVAVVDEESKLSLYFTSSKQVMIPARAGEELNLHFTLSSGDTPVNSPVSICFVIDVSTSMRSQMLIMKSTLKTVLEQLRSFDKLSIVTFSNSSKVELELTTMDADGRKLAEDVISRLDVIGGTNVEAGILGGIDIFSKVNPIDASPIESIILFTDGEVNDGCTSYFVMKATADNAIQSIVTASAQQSVDRLIVISVVAFGTSPNKHLKLISNTGKGFYFLINSKDDPNCINDMPTVFGKAVGISQITAANGIVLKIKANSQVQICAPTALPDNYNMTMSGSDCSISIPFITNDNPIDMIFPITFTKDTETYVHCEVLATAKLSAYSIISKKQVNLESKCGVIIDPTHNESCDYSARELNYFIQILRTKLVQTLLDVEEAGVNGNLESVSVMIKEMLENLLGSSMLDEESIKCFIETLLVVSNEVGSVESYNKRGAKILEMLKQSHMYQMNNVIGDIRIPRTSEILSDTNLDFVLREHLDLSVYDGEEQRRIRTRSIANFEPIYADARQFS